MDTLAPVLRTLTDPLSIDGHTNQVKVEAEVLPERLGALGRPRRRRAALPARPPGQVPDDRMTATAYGHEKPLVNPSKPGSQEVNKRVDIVVQSPLPSETRSLMSEVLKARKLPVGEQP